MVIIDDAPADQSTRAIVAPGPRRSSRGVRAMSRSFRRHWQLYLLMIVPLAYFAIFKYVPMANAIIAFKDYNVVDGVWGSPWVGFE